MWLLWSLGCTCGAPRLEASSQTYGAPSLREVTTRFDDQQLAPLDPARAFRIAGRCPVLTRAELTPGGTGYARLRVEGSGLERVVRVAGGLPDGRLVDLSMERKDGALETPVLAPDVEIWFGVNDDGIFAACRGPGHSLSIRGFTLQP